MLERLVTICSGFWKGDRFKVQKLVGEGDGPLRRTYCGLIFFSLIRLVSKSQAVEGDSRP